MNSTESIITLQQARELVMLLEHEQIDDANALIAEVCAPKADQLFEQVGHLTRQLHNSLNEFMHEPRLTELANQDIPDARDRLNYVIEMTDSAANRTMDAVELSLPLADKLNDSIQAVMPSWQHLMSRNLSLVEFKSLCHQLDGFLNQSAEDADNLRNMLTDILMAQDFQDLTGQVIRRVIALVQEVENGLVKMLTLFGDERRETNVTPKEDNSGAIAAEGPIHNPESRDDVVNSQDDVDDLLSSLGF